MDRIAILFETIVCYRRYSTTKQFEIIVYNKIKAWYIISVDRNWLNGKGQQAGEDNMEITERMRKNWTKYAKSHTAIEFSMYLKYTYRQMLIDEGSSVLKFWIDANMVKVLELVNNDTELRIV